MRFEKRRNDHYAIWHRDVFSLVSIDEMKKIINGQRGWGYLRDTEWRDGRYQEAEEITAEFGSCRQCADFIEQVERLQKERMAKAA
mgnify:CR=1 FL=1